MMSLRRLLPLLLLNIVVSAVVVLSILFWWDRRDRPDQAAAQATVTAVLSALPAATTPETAVGEAQAAEATPAPAADEQPIHVVQAGDTLGRISERYEVSIEDIMAANGLTNPDLLSVGQQLIIPVGGVPATPTPEATAVLPTPIPSVPAAQGEARIQITGVIGAGSLEEEAVQIVNSGSGPQNLAGWLLLDTNNNAYKFGQISIFGEGAGILLHTRAGQDSPADLYWGLDEAVWQPGETISLRDADNQERASFTVP